MRLDPYRNVVQARRAVYMLVSSAALVLATPAQAHGPIPGDELGYYCYLALVLIVCCFIYSVRKTTADGHYKISTGVFLGIVAAFVSSLISIVGLFVIFFFSMGGPWVAWPPIIFFLWAALYAAVRLTRLFIARAVCAKSP